MTTAHRDQWLLIRESAEKYLAEALRRGYWVSPNSRVGTPDAARLHGISPGHMKNLISQGKGPIQSGSGGGFRKTVALLDLAEWEYTNRHSSPLSNRT